MKKKQPNKFFEMKKSADGKSGDIFIYGEITSYEWGESDVTTTSFKRELDELGDVTTINLYINSPGGSVFEGIAIHNMLKRHKAKVVARVDGLAASIASVIVMAGDTIIMPKNSMMMIHQPWTFAIGNSAELRKQADDLDRIGKSSMQSYLEKAGDKLTEEELIEMLDAETWLSADEAYEYGLCNVVEEENQAVASISDELFSHYKNVPKQLIDLGISGEEVKKRREIAEQARLNQQNLKRILGGILQ